ncbi:hypothetical protein COO60DRAFT_1624430 [Scenedesmus sp. NREL 46B-D3]|nr:hypothetical protein COO60DRAFT_1624430 [Scenedesmus sp. NREL 46B-D3]
MCVCFRSSATFGIRQGILCSVRHWPPTTLPPLMWRASRGTSGQAELGQLFSESTPRQLDRSCPTSMTSSRRWRSRPRRQTCQRTGESPWQWWSQPAGPVLDFLIERHDLLVAKGEFKHDPSLVQALEQGLSGVDGLPITSSRVMQLLEKQASARVVALTKQSAKASGGPSRSGGGSSNPPA